jgi:hypothetical protein
MTGGRSLESESGEETSLEPSESDRPRLKLARFRESTCFHFKAIPESVSSLDETCSGMADTDFGVAERGDIYTIPRRANM